MPRRYLTVYRSISSISLVFRESLQRERLIMKLLGKGRSRNASYRPLGAGNSDQLAIHRRSHLLGAVLITVAIAFGLSASTAGAKICGYGAMSVCLVTDGLPAAIGAPADPLVLPRDIAVEVGPPIGAYYGFKATRGTVRVALEPEYGSELSWVSLTPQADELWHGTLSPQQGNTGSIPGDGLQRIRVSYECPATGGPVAYELDTPPPCGKTDVPLLFESLAAVVKTEATIQRKGRFFISTLAFTSRVPVTVNFRSSLQLRRGHKLSEPRRFRRSASTQIAPGRHKIRRRISAKSAKRACRRKQRCFVALRGDILSPEGLGLVGTEERIRIRGN